MNTAEFLKALSEYQCTENMDIKMEFPGLCGKSDAGKNCKQNPACKSHGHLSLSVDTETFYDVVGKRERVILLTLPQTIIDDILK